MKSIQPVSFGMVGMIAVEAKYAAPFFVYLPKYFPIH
jgi:hypothetical protein